MRGVVAFFLILYLISHSSKSQDAEVKFQRFTLDQGLSMNFITYICQDKQGFIWVGTSDGLNKYDGYRFTTYRNNPDVTGSISDNSIFTIYVDKQGVLYVGTENGGLNIYNRENDKFITYKNDPADGKSISSNRVISILEDNAGTLWVGTEDNGLNIFDRKSKTFIHYLHDENNTNSITNNLIRSLAEERNGNLWIGTDKGISVLSADRKKFKHYLHDENNSKGLSVNPIRKIFVDKEDNVWIGTSFGGLNKFDKKSDQFIHYRQGSPQGNNLLGEYIMGICEDDQNNLWITTNYGLSVLNKNTNVFHNYQNDPFDRYSLIDNGLNTVFCDRDNNIWIGSMAGLSMKEFLPAKFSHITGNLGKPQSLGGKEVFCLYQDSRKRVWIGLRLGFDLYDRNANTFTHYRTFPTGQGIPTITSIYEDRHGILWLGMYEGIARYDINNNICKIFNYADPKDQSSKQLRDVWYIQEDAHGDMYISSFVKSIFKYDRLGDRFVPFKYEGYPISQIDPTCFYIDKRNNFWIGSRQDGLLQINIEKNTHKVYKHDQGDKKTLSNNHTLSICEDHSGNIWVGTKSGLNLLDIKTNTFVSYRQQNGLPNDQINGIQEDSKGKLWLSTNNGISNFDPEVRTFKNFDNDDGLQHNEFWHRASYKLRSGEILFGGLNGFNIINPDKILFNSKVPAVYITDFQIFNKPVPVALSQSPLQKSISETQVLTLSYDQSVFSFEFVALNYVISKKNQYAYKMDGFDEDWNYVGTQRKATYTNLDPGKYTFRVKASNNDGLWNENGTAIKLIITPPFWLTWWFRFSVVLLLIGIIYLLYVIKTNQIKKENKRLEAGVIERTQKIELQKQEILKNRDELKQLNLEISNQNEILEKKVEERTHDLQALNEELAANEEELRQTLDQTLNINTKLIESEDKLMAQNLELRKVNTELDSFVYSASHDLRAPLSSLLGLIHIAKIEPLAELKANYFAMMENSIYKLDTFIKSIITYSKNARLEVRVQPIDFDEISNEVFDNLKYMDRSEVIEKKLTITGNAVFFSDAFRLSIIFNNIISNAIRYSNPNVCSSIHIRIALDDRKAIIEFEDNGCGIAEERIDKIFEMFYRASEASVGSGLGLYIVKEAVQAMEGTIQVNSKLGSGTLFRIQLPNLKNNAEA